MDSGSKKQVKYQITQKSKKLPMERLCICPKDIEIVLGKSERQARNILNKIKIAVSKQKHQSVTINEFCEYQSLKIIEVKALLKIK